MASRKRSSPAGCPGLPPPRTTSTGAPTAPWRRRTRRTTSGTRWARTRHARGPPSERHPQGADVARRVADYLDTHEVRLPDGAPLTVRAFQSAGAMLGQADGSHALHYLLEDPFAGEELSDAFLYAMMDQLSFAGGPLYALLHEA